MSSIASSAVDEVDESLRTRLISANPWLNYMPYLDVKLVQDNKTMSQVVNWCVDNLHRDFTWCSWTPNSWATFCGLATHGFLPMTMDLDDPGPSTVHKKGKKGKKKQKKETKRFQRCYFHC